MLIPLRRLPRREQHYDEALRLMSIIDEVCKNGVSHVILKYEYPLRYCLDLSDLDGTMDCSACPISNTMENSDMGYGDKACIHNVHETVMRESGIEIDESMAIMHICNDTPRKFQATLVWISWIASKVSAIFMAELAQQELLLYDKPVLQTI